MFVFWVFFFIFIFSIIQIREGSYSSEHEEERRVQITRQTQEISNSKKKPKVIPKPVENIGFLCSKNLSPDIRSYQNPEVRQHL